jgi:hypothetical protein
MTEQRVNYDVVVIGGGAAGIVASISARRTGASVLLCEKMPRLGKKILVSGNGRCNLLNESLTPSFYNPEAREWIDSVLAQFGKKEILHFFKELGLAVYAEKGRVFPITNQAASVMDVLLLELSRRGVEVRCDCEVKQMSQTSAGFSLALKAQDPVMACQVILCGGGKSYPVSGSDGSAYRIAENFGHRLIAPVPSAVPLVVEDPWCGHLQGQKIHAVVTTRIAGSTSHKADGELLFTKYGLSGTAILDVSEDISIALNRQSEKAVEIIVDLLPSFHEETLQRELSSRLRKKFPTEKLLAGLLPPKFAFALSAVLESKDPARIAAQIKNKKFSVTGTRGWEEADFTAGGIDMAGVEPKTLESKLCRGFYLAGEILNVQGARGGYNLAWAWASGFIAGQAAGDRLKGIK